MTIRYLSIMSSCCRKANNNGFLIGMFFGLIISLLFYQMSSISNLDETSGAAEGKNPWSYLSLLHDNLNTDYELTNQINKPTSNDQDDEYAPKLKNFSSLHINQDTKHQWRLTRPRYYFTELGIREKLFLGVLTDPEHLHSRGVTFNKTVGHFIEKIRYFITISGSENGNKKPNVSLSGIVGFTDTRKILKPFHVVKYIIDNYLEEYDYYFIVKDTSYINGRQLLNLVESFSVGSNKDIYLGVPISENKNDNSYINDNLINFCSLDAGIIISNSIMRQLKKNLDWCVKNTLLYSSPSDDVNFGRCLYYTTKTPCNNKVFHGNQEFLTKKLSSDFDFAKELKNFYLDDLISVYPILDATVIYKLHAYAAAKELKKIEDEMMKLRNEISGSSHLSPVTNKTSWPVGISPGNKPPGRFDVLRWNYFNQSHVFMESDFDNVQPLIGSKKLEVDYVVKIAKQLIQDKYDSKFKFDKLVNGYMRFDASRGMDYIVDLSFNDDNEAQVIKRVELCKPLGKVEVLGVPYVTENTRVNLVLIVDKNNIDECLKFIEQYGSVCMEKRDKTTLMLVFLYTDSTKVNDIYTKVKSQVVNLTDKYNKSKELSKLIWLSIQLPEIQDPKIDIAITDLIVKKFSIESLILFVQTQMELTTDYLNRIRMNTINNWQVFSPIPFVEYNPDLYEIPDQKIKFDLNHNHGHYDKFNYQSISFYVKDYRSARRSSEKVFPQIHSDREIKQLLKTPTNNINSLFELFVLYSDLHIFRAIEPALKIHYDNKNNCKTAVGHRGQLARLIDEFHQEMI